MSAWPYRLAGVALRSRRSGVARPSLLRTFAALSVGSPLALHQLDGTRCFLIDASGTEVGRLARCVCKPAPACSIGSGSGEMLCTWARDHGVKGTGVDMSALLTEQARRGGQVADHARWLAASPGDELAAEPVRYATYTREHLGWGCSR